MNHNSVIPKHVKYYASVLISVTLRTILIGTLLLMTSSCLPKSENDKVDEARDLDGQIADNGDEAENTPSDNDAMTLSPESCQADIKVLREEDIEVRNHPLVHKKDFFGYRNIQTNEGTKLALKSLITDEVLAVTGQSIPGINENEKLSLGNPFVVSPDLGLENDPDYPVAFTAITRDSAFNSHKVLLRSDGKGGLLTVVKSKDTVSLGNSSGVVDAISDIFIGPQGDLFFYLSLQNDEKQYLFKQSYASGGVSLVLAEGTSLSTGDSETLRFVGKMTHVKPTNFGDVVVRVDVVDSQGETEGFADLNVHYFGGVTQCLRTDTSILCGGILVPDGHSIAASGFDSDGTTTGSISLNENKEPQLDFKVVGLPIEETIKRGEEYQGFNFNSFKQPKVCEQHNSLYFVGGVWAQSAGYHDELIRIDENGKLHQLTNFKSLLSVDSLKGEVPDEIRDWDIGYNCDAMLYTWGPSSATSSIGYEGYWAVYHQGDVMEIIDETPGRENGNGDINQVSRARSGIDPNAGDDAVTNIGPDGEFYFVPLIEKSASDSNRAYVVATKPLNRCRAPNIVNSEADFVDVAPGDGRCDTGSLINDQAECTLRAAIQETNANPGSDSIEIKSDISNISLLSALPAITSALTIEGASIVDGSQLSDAEIGIDVQISGVHIKGGLSVKNFPSHGLKSTSPINLTHFSSTFNCGWGLWLEEEASLLNDSNLLENANIISSNGNGDNCTAGGIFSSNDNRNSPSLRIANSEITNNNGPGILSHGVINISNSTVSENSGDGILVGSPEGSFGNTRLILNSGTLTVNDNQGHGINVFSGNFKSKFGSVDISGNCGWGIWLEDGIVRLNDISNSSDSNHKISFNGSLAQGSEGVFWGLDSKFSTRNCEGGGVSLLGTEPDGFEELSWIYTSALSENRGPGIASTGAWKIGSTHLQRNYGPGVLIGESDDLVIESPVLQFVDGDNIVLSNFGSGIQLEAGSISIKGGMSITDNHGAGIETTVGNIQINQSSDLEYTNIERNGLANEECKSWSLSTGVWTSTPIGVCSRNEGVITQDGNVKAYKPNIQNNGGAGLSAANPTEDNNGTIELVGGTVCDNGESDVAKVKDYSSVIESCDN